MKLAGVILIFALSGLAKDWKTGQVKVLDTDKWCGEQTAAHFPGICGVKGEHAPILFHDSGWGSPQPPNPVTQILEIDTVDTIYIVKREALDGGVQLKPGAEAQYAADGKRLLIRIRPEPPKVHDPRHPFPAGWQQNKVQILETRKR
jgi:hypothetical protein